MLETAHKKNPRSKYFNPRSGISTQPGKRKFRRNNFRPSFHKYSETVPTGQSQLQNALRNKNAIATNVTSKNIAAGCSSGTCLVTKKYFRFIMPAMGGQPDIHQEKCKLISSPQRLRIIAIPPPDQFLLRNGPL